MIQHSLFLGKKVINDFNPSHFFKLWIQLFVTHVSRRNECWWRYLSVSKILGKSNQRTQTLSVLCFPLLRVCETYDFSRPFLAVPSLEEMQKHGICGMLEMKERMRKERRKERNRKPNGWLGAKKMMEWWRENERQREETKIKMECWSWMSKVEIFSASFNFLSPFLFCLHSYKIRY